MMSYAAPNVHNPMYLIDRHAINNLVDNSERRRVFLSEAVCVRGGVWKVLSAAGNG